MDVYTHGHHESVLAAHRWRTAQNSAGYLLPHLRPGMRLLDVGCGPGSVTRDLAEVVASGEVIGIDCVPDVVDQATAQGHTSVRFQVGDVYRLDFPDADFDVVHAHQVLQHLSDPVAALREMRRVTRPGGLVAVRDGDYGAMTWYPPSAGLDEWSRLYHEVTRANHAEADAGRRLYEWVLAAGFDPAGVQPSADTWCFAVPERRRWWAQLWAERAVSSGFAVQAKEYGLADDDALARIQAAWREWGEQPGGWFAILHGEVLAKA